ncbi:thiol-disulfide oxidoreductase DCC family protein [Pedococcus sp. 2YAF34]|uniref:thiol-disulfide oxidoreductase DCC family protein n=1 Tax=Pedococcus sp. 2YAF34 TaxID=3233032 RepID=UPI003F9A4FD3
MDMARDRERGLLIFDGDCGFCTTSARFVSRWVDRRDRYDVRPWQELDLGSLGVTEAECVEAAQFVRRDGSVVAGHRAIAAGLTHGAPMWRPLGHLLTVPGISQLAARVYAWVADHRYALPGGTAACAPGIPAQPQ